METQGKNISDKFRNATGMRYTRALFYEMGVDTGNQHAIYTLADRDKGPYISLRRLYLEENDVTEYSFAIKYLDGFDHWELLCSCDWFKPHLKKWRRELQLKLESQAMQVIQLEASSSNSQNRFQANKIILDRIAKLNPPKVRGRPSRSEVDAELKLQASLQKEIQQDMERMNGASN